jgi:hypothetical protein
MIIKPGKHYLNIMKSLILNILIPGSFFIMVSFMTGCKKEEVLLSLNTTEITLKPNETFNLVVSPDASGCVFKSENDNIAEVYASGLIEARLVGETSIVVTNSDKGYLAKCKVTVIPEYNMYREPYLDFGKQKSNIKSYETRQIFLENDTTILYSGENQSIDSLMYSFDESAYTSSLCAIPSSQSTLLINYLTERYVFYGSLTTGLTARLTTDGKTFVVTQNFSSSRIYVYYFPKTTTKNGTGMIYDSESVKTLVDIKNKSKGFSLKE